ncbi:MULTISPECIES: type VI secretion system protein TssA [Aliivibrio]|uniref:Type VI secretion system protein TssA n=1 Tax=Aliivibrio finisterrensis TaxID=511998 RepID=A0A4Q5KTP1_9GAMM|nr:MULTISPECIES: type VI secretion system protein TssA [Aliivibrio]MDD9179288.1 type VI secretion system protein TssA [Aliivibrio sp. A6]RYU51124.1 type VI secretion system protein TssA [Aliivibrio finisterrensis]RYU55524.1 type VI secretion system protein TssA [Aliivibrio finisterrensis]RYU60378.1 type VI secretion system protein TssA [Aliivibrio finisterrensis]RYU64151.1 type VI secretion system protein TssA [Aliivibrio finisterrensis]
MYSYNNILTDISGENRFGTDLSYESEFEAIENEVSNSTNLFATSKTDWSLVRGNSLNLLENQTKDYRLIYWVLLSIQKEGLTKELIVLTPIINSFIIKYKSDVFPSRKKRLYSSINQSVNIINEIAKELINHIDKIESIDEFVVLFSDLETTISTIFESNTDNVSSIINQLKTHKKRLKSSILKDIPDAPVPSQKIEKKTAVASDASLSFTQTEITNDRDANKALRHLQDVARSLSKYWLNQRINDEKVYQLNRTLTWLTIAQVPASNDSKVTMLKPVPQARQQHFQQLKNEANHSKLLIEIEESLSKSPFWLDGHFMVWEILTELKHDDAAQSVIDQLTLLLKKTPDIITLKFDDGSEFANASTKAWLEQQCSEAKSTPVSSQSSFIESNTKSEWDSTLRDAQEQLLQSSLSEALHPLILGHHHSRSAREAFFWQFSQAKLLSHAKKFDLAIPLLRWLDTKFSGSVLRDWDPVLEERLLELWLSCQNQQPVKEQDKAVMAQLRERLCCLNPMRVLS